jgi:hypothetical protein
MQTQNGTNGTAMQLHGPTYGSIETVKENHSRALEPSNFEEGLRLAKVVVDSGMFGVKNQADAFVRISTGMGLGLSSVQSLRGIHVISGKPGLSADLMMALCLQSPDCDFFRMVESTNTKATFEAKRIRDDKATPLTFTMEDAERAGLTTTNANYKKYPAQMLRARCIAGLARLVFPEKMHGLYTPDELRDAKTVVDIDAPPVEEIVVEAEPQRPKVEAKPKPDFLAMASDLEIKLSEALEISDVDALSADYSPKFRGASADTRSKVKDLFSAARKRITDAFEAIKAEAEKQGG